MKKKILITISIVLLITIITIIIFKTILLKHQIPDNWEIKITPLYYFEPGNSLLIYDNYYIVTYSFADKNENLIYLKKSINKELVEQIKNEILEETAIFDKKFSYYSVELKNDNKKYYHKDNINVIKKVENIVNNNIWYVKPSN